MVRSLSVFTLKLQEVVPDCLLVRKISAPLNVDKRARISSSFDLIAQLQWPACRILIIVGPNLKPRGLAFHSSLLVFESGNRKFVHAVRTQQGIAALVTINWQRGRFLRRYAESVGTVTKAAEPDAGRNAISR